MLEAAGLVPETERSSRAAPLYDIDVQAILRSVEKVVVCRGRKAVELPGARAGLDDLKGPTGNFRAPLLHLDDTLLVGFNRQALEQLLVHQSREGC